MVRKMPVNVRFDRVKHEYSDAAGTVYPSVTQILAHGGIVNFDMVTEEARQRSMRRGTSVHFACELYDLGALNRRTLPKALRGYVKAWVTWRERSGFRPLLIEKPILSPHGYAGTPDRFGTLGNRYAVVDLKTGEGSVSDWIRYQIAAYVKYFEFTEFYVGMPGLRRVAVKLHADGTYHAKEFPPSTYVHDFAVFYEALKNWRAKDADNARVRQGTATTH